MVKYVEIMGQEHPVIYNLPAMFWFTDWLGVPITMLDSVIAEQMTERKGAALLYSGLVAGAELEGKRNSVSFSEFQEFLFLEEGGPEVMELLGAQWQEQFEVIRTKIEAQTKKLTKKKTQKRAPITKES